MVVATFDDYVNIIINMRVPGDVIGSERHDFLRPLEVILVLNKRPFAW